MPLIIRSASSSCQWLRYLSSWLWLLWLLWLLLLLVVLFEPPSSQIRSQPRLKKPWVYIHLLAAWASAQMPIMPNWGQAIRVLVQARWKSKALLRGTYLSLIWSVQEVVYVCIQNFLMQAVTAPECNKINSGAIPNSLKASAFLP